MALSDKAKKMAAGAASVAVATSGLSSCGTGGGGVVDPAPPPLQCNNVSAGEVLRATATRTDNTVTVTMNDISGTVSAWQVTQISNVTGATLGTIPSRTGREPLVLPFTLATPTTTQVTFTVAGRFTGFQGESCDFLRNFTATITPNGVQVTQLNLDLLPLPARQRAQIAIVTRREREVELEVQSSFVGVRTVSWDVTGGAVETLSSDRVRWTLPAEPGIYQAELVVDYGRDGLAFDVMMFEVR